MLRRAQRLGLIGAGVVLEDQLTHAEGFAVVGPPTADFPAVDLGSGNGLPGLVLASIWPASMWWLVEASTNRCEFLRWAVAALSLVERVEILEGPAEDFGRQTEFRGQADLVVSRAFGPPALTAECAAAFLRVGGRLAVSEPPSRDMGRWPEAGLARLGLELGPLVAEPTRLQVMVQQSEVPADYPRRAGVPRRRPLF